MKNFIVRVAIPCMVLSAIATLYSCKKDNVLPSTVDQQVGGAALATTSTSTASYTVSTFTRRTSDVNFTPLGICSSAEGSMYVTSFDQPAIFKLGINNVYTKFIDMDGLRGIKAGANGSLYFVKQYVINNSVLDSFNIFKVDRSKKVTLIPHTETLSFVEDMAIGPDSSLYLTEMANCRIIKITKDGVQSVFAGKKGVKGYADGPRDKAHFTNPTYLKFGEDGNLWVVDGAVYSSGQRIRKVSKDGSVTTVFTLKYDYVKDNRISSFAVTKRDKNFNLTPNQNVFFFVTAFADANRRVRYNQLFHLSNNKVLTPITGNNPEPTNEDPYEKNGPAQQASFFNPTSITINPKGIFIADNQGWSVRRILKD